MVEKHRQNIVTIIRSNFPQLENKPDAEVLEFGEKLIVELQIIEHRQVVPIVQVDPK